MLEPPVFVEALVVLPIIFKGLYIIHPAPYLFTVSSVRQVQFLVNFTETATT